MVPAAGERSKWLLYFLLLYIFVNNGGCGKNVGVVELPPNGTMLQTRGATEPGKHKWPLQKQVLNSAVELDKPFLFLNIQHEGESHPVVLLSFNNKLRQEQKARGGSHLWANLGQGSTQSWDSTPDAPTFGASTRNSVIQTG